MRSRRRSLIALGTIMSLAVVASAVAGGGGSIATAPPLPLGQTVTSGWDVSGPVNNTGRYGEFWRLQLGTGDRVVIDWAQLSKSSGCAPGIILAFYNPSVTDFTISQSQPSARQEAAVTKYQFVWVAPQDGNWTLFFSSGCARQEGYSLNANVQRFTTTTLAPSPALVRKGSVVRVRGAVKPTVGGNVLATVRGPRGFASLRKVVALKAGTFSFKFKASMQGVYTIRASFPGDATHRPSRSKVYSLRAG